MDINFCDGCENILYIYTDEENKLYLGCKVCGEKKDYVNNKSNYSNEFNLDFSETINNNKYLSFDNTLPVINNKNIKHVINEAIVPGAYFIFPIIKKVIKNKLNLLIIICN